MNVELLLQLLINGLIVGMLYGVVAMCFVLIYKSTQVVNFAQGEFVVLGAWVCWAFVVQWQMPFVVGFIFALVFMTLYGIIVQMVILRPLIGEPIISVIMVTIGLSIFMQAGMNWIFGNNAERFPQVFGDVGAVSIGGLNIEAAYLMSLVLSLVIMAGFFWFFQYSRFGLAMRATAFNQQIAQSLGISVKQVFAMAWAISALVSGVAGVVLGLVNAVSNALAFIGVKVFPAVIVGGLDSIVGAIVGGVIIGVLENLAEFFDGQYLHIGNLYTVAPFYVLILILVIKPYGLFGTKDIEDLMAHLPNPRPSGDFRSSYAADMTLFQTRAAMWAVIAGVVVLCAFAPFLSRFWLSQFILIGMYGIAALGLNVLVGFTGQISLGHAAFFGFGAFASAWLNTTTGIPVFLTIPLAGLMTTAVGMIFGLPAARIKGLYLAIATLASQFILEDFFARAVWFTGGSSGSLANTVEIFGFAVDDDLKYFYLVLFWTVVSYVAVANLMRSRDGRAFVAVRDHYLSAEIMGLNLTKYRVMSFGVSSFFAGLAGALYGHYLGFVSAEAFTILLSIQFLAMIIIGGLGSVSGSLLGAAFILLLPELALALADLLAALFPGMEQGKAYVKEMSIGAAIILFLIFEPEGLIHRFRLIRASWKLFPFSH